MSDIEYRETVVFDLFPQYEYTRIQRKRLVLFHCYAKNIRKTIRYAAHFDAPNRICLVYVVGQPKEDLIRRLLEETGCSDRVCVLTSPFPDFGLSVWEAYDTLRRRLSVMGHWDRENERPNQKYEEEYEKNRRMHRKYPDNTVILQFIQQFQSDSEVIHQYRRLQKASRNTYFKNWRLIRRGCLTKPFTHARLDELIERIYPIGVEAKHGNDYVSLSPAAIQPSIQWAADGTPNRKLGLDESMIAPAAKSVAGFITKQIEDKGYVNLSELARFCQSPPMGLDYNGFSAAVIRRAVERFRNRSLFYYDSVCSHPFWESPDVVFQWVFSPLMERNRVRHHTACLYLESAPHKRVKQFMEKLWGIKIEMPGDLMGFHLSRRLTRDHRVPLAYVDPRLLRLTLWNVKWYDRADVEQLADEVTQHGDEIMTAYRRYKAENSNVPDAAMSLLRADYSWVWDAEEYKRILRTTARFGPWPWSLEVQRKIAGEEKGA